MVDVECSLTIAIVDVLGRRSIQKIGGEHRSEVDGRGYRILHQFIRYQQTDVPVDASFNTLLENAHKYTLG